ncbi:MAG: FkbM family methyltransferase [Pseudomonadota bacterium]
MIRLRMRIRRWLGALAARRTPAESAPALSAPVASTQAAPTQAAPTPSAARPPKRAFARGPFEAEGLRLALNPYGAYALREALLSRPAARVVADGRVWEPQTLALIRARAAQGGDVVHAGTFFGDFLPALCGGLREGARLWAFEPNPDSFALARLTARLNGLSALELRHAGLSDRHGAGRLRVAGPDGEALGGMSHLVEAAEDAVGTAEVPLLRLDEAVPADRRVAVVQLDVEGHEAAALRGGAALIRRWRPMLVLERFETPELLEEIAPRARYRQVGEVEANAVFAPLGEEV